MVESGECESRMNGNPGCPLVDCLPIGEQCGETFCKPGSECCMGCDGPLGICEVKREDGGYGCSIPKRGEPPCPLVHCEVPITVEPPIIIDPPIFCCEAITAECEACKLGVTVEEYCMKNPKMDGCSPIVG